MISGNGYEVTLKGEGCSGVPEECSGSHQHAIQAAKDDASMNACGVKTDRVQAFEMIGKPLFFSRGRNSFCASITARVVCRSNQKPKVSDKKEL
ncbi:MAG: hypothetical protein HN337_05840 [Deltaproteobacteria bacterium]|jgi:hypothetical protein|nr:hypothetical protein [Deltaproteobacteria bacterium]